MLNHTYTSVKNANLVDCGKKQHIPSQPTPLLKENFLGEFRTELDKKKVLAALGIATELSLEWGNIKGDIGDNLSLIRELDARTKYISNLDGITKTIGEGIAYLESVVGREEAGETEQDRRITELETSFITLQTDVTNVQNYLTDTVDINIAQLQEDLDKISESVKNITSLIQVSTQEGNALSLLEGDKSGLYVPDLSGRVASTESNIGTLQANIETIEKDFVKRSEFGDGDLDFVSKNAYDSFSTNTSNRLGALESEIKNTVKTGEDGHVATLYANTISKNNDDGNITITDSFEVTADKPLDVRFVRESIDDLLSLPVSVCYEGMGVIVKSLSSLYILKPAEGALTQEYISDINNWKCPEDLVTVAMTQSDYDNLEEKNPNVFYYIYEEEFTLTRPPRREEYETDEDFENARISWEEQVKSLDQQYVSASWGIEIEDLLSKKASNESVNLLKKEINAIKGGGDGPSLGTLGISIAELQSKTQTLESNTQTNSNLIENLETNVSGIEQSLSSYVTKTELQDETQEFIFVKTSKYEEDKATFSQQLDSKVETKEVTTTDLNAVTFNLNNTEIKIVDEYLTIDDNPVAFSDDLIKVEVLTQSDYNNKEAQGEIDSEVYYYTYEDENPMATKAELQKALDRISTLETNLMLLTKQVAILEEQIKSSTPSE